MQEKINERLVFIINAVYIGIILGIVYLLGKCAFSIILPFFLAFCIVSVINPIARRLTRRLPVKKSVVSVVVMALIYLLAGSLLFWLIVQAVYFLFDIFEIVPDFYRNSLQPAFELFRGHIDGAVAKLPWEVKFRAAEVQDNIIEGLYEWVVTLSQKGIDKLSDMAAKIPGFFITFLFTIMLSFFISMQYDEVSRFIKRQLPEKVRTSVSGIRGVIRSIACKYAGAVMKLMFITFLILSAGLLLLRAPNAILIAAVIAVFDALPILGTGIIMIPWALTELMGGNVPFAAGIAVTYGIALVVKNILEPKIIGDKLGMNPIVSLISIYCGYRIWGVFGMIIMPVMMQILLEMHHRGNIRLFREAETNPKEA